MPSSSNKQILDTIRQRAGNNKPLLDCLLELYKWELNSKGYQFKEKYRQAVIEFSREVESDEN